MNIGDKVLIGGRTMLRPGISLVGLQGMVMPSAANVPANCTTVLINWQEQGYTQTDDLPPLVNVLTEHLEPVTTDSNSNIELPRLSLSGSTQTKRPALGLVRDEDETATPNETVTEVVTEETMATDDTPPSEEAEEAPEERPRLRLL